jgi:hypothetical protein
MKIRPVEPSCSMWMNGRTDGRADKQDKANSRFSQFANAPKNEQVLSRTAREQT